MTLEDRQAWFREARFGLFVHYGLYSLAARHEWVRQYEHLDDAQYQRYFDHFRADRLDARAWARSARDAGMKYAVLTTKHHDGFCLWDSALTEFKSTRSPAGRDLVREYVDACREVGLKVGLYHSLIDWHHPHFPIDGIHPDFDPVTVEAVNAGRDGRIYVEYLHAQVQELLERFEPDLLWFDFSYPSDALVPSGKGADFWRSEELVAMIREHHPAIVLNDRLDLPSSADFFTPEEMQPDSDLGGLWEACRTLNGSFGYAPGYGSWLDAGQVIRLLVDSVAKDGNLLLNVGPTGRGDFEPRAEQILTEVGRWVDRHDAAVHGAGPSVVPAPRGCTVTANGDRVFIHVTGGWPTGHLVLTGLPAPLRYASFLHDGAEVRFALVDETRKRVPHDQPAGPPGATVLTLPLARPDVEVPVIELDLGGVDG